MYRLAEKWIKELPSITGQDAYEISKFVSLNYWEDIKRSYIDFIKEAIESNELSVCLVVGEWGLGKTSSFKSFVKQYLDQINSASILIKTRDYIDFFKNMFSEPLLISEKAVKALLLVINKVLKLNIDESISTKEFLEAMFTKINKDRLFIFLDEFESVIDEDVEVASRVIEGITSLINGEYEPLSRTGKYRGKLHFILSMTPQALSKFQSEIRFHETKGRMLRRIKKTIELRPLNRGECYELLIGYLKYIYDGKLPEPLPISTLSILDSIMWGGRRNPGYMVLIFNTLLSSLITKEDPTRIRIATIEDLEQALKSPLTWDLMRESSAIELGYLDNLDALVTSDIESEKIRRVVSKVLRVLAILPFPLTKREIMELTDSDSESEIDVALRIIDAKLSAIYRKPILRFHSFPKKDVVEKIKEIIISEGLESILRDKLIKFLDYLKRYTYSSGKIIEEITLPDKDDLEMVLREIAEETGIKEDYLLVILSGLLNLKPINTLYRFIRDIYQNIYPPSCPICKAVKEKEEAQKIWRTALRSVSESDVDPLELGLAMIPLVILNAFFNENDYLENYVIRKRVNYGQTLIELKFGSLGLLDRKKLDPSFFINRFSDLLNRAPIILIFTKPDLSKYAEKLRDHLKETHHVEIFTLGTTDIAKLLGLRILKRRGVKLFDSEVREIIKQIRERYNINEDALERLIPSCDEKGIIISRPAWDPKSSIIDIPRVYDYYLAQPRAKILSTEVFKWISEHVKKYVFYGLRGRDIPCGIDIESSDRLRSLENYMIRNGFLKEIAGGLMVCNSSIENRIIMFARNKGEFTLSELKNIFVFELSDGIEKNILRDIYIENLKRKGYLEELDRKVGRYRFIDLAELERESREVIESAGKEINERSVGFRKIAHLIVVKERGYRFINLNEFVNEIETLADTGYMMSDELDKRRLLKTAIRLKHVLLDIYIRVVERAFEEIKRLHNRLETAINDIRKNAAKICEILRLVNINLKPNQIIELSGLENKLRDVMNILEMDISEDFVKETLSKIKENIFDFKRLSARDFSELRRAYYFNMKYYLIKRIYDEVNEIMTALDKGLGEIKDIAEFPKEINRIKRDIRSYLGKIFGEDIAKDFDILFADLVLRAEIPQRIHFNEFIELINNVNNKKTEIKNALEYILNALKAIQSKTSRIRNVLWLINQIKKQINLGNLDQSKEIRHLIDLEKEYHEKEEEIKIAVKGIVNYKDFLLLIKGFNRLIDNLLNFEKYLQSRIDEVNDRDEIIKEKLDRAREYLEKMHRMKPLIKDKISEDKASEIGKIIDELEKKYLEGREFIRIEEELESLIEYMHSIIGAYLHPITQEFLNALYSSKIKRLSLRDIIKTISLKLDEDETEVLAHIMDKLKELLRDGKVDIIIEKR